MTKKPYDGSFQPASGDHALMEMSVFLNFSNTLDDDIMKKLEGLRHDLFDDLPVYQETSGLVFQIQGDGHNISSSQEKLENIGFELKRIGPNGDPTWVVIIGRKTVSIHCLSYTRWNEVWPKISSYIRLIFRRIGFVPNILNSVGMKCLDGFKYSEPKNLYRVNELFNSSSKSIPSNVFKNNNFRWHSHTGWYSQYELNSNIEILNQLNINAGYAALGGARTHLTTIDHTQTVHSKPSGDVGTRLGDLSTDNEFFEGLMYKIHEMNKITLHKLLNEQVTANIGLNHV